MTKTKKRPKLKAFLLSMMLVFTFIFSNGGTKAEADGISALVVGAAYKLQNRTTGMFVDGMGYSTNGANCGQWTYSDSSNQRWVLEASGSYYKFRNAATGLYLDGMGRISAGSVYGQWASSSSDNQKWRIEVSGNYYKIVNVATGLVLDGGGNTGNGSDLKQWDNVSSTNLEWSFIPVNETYTGMRNITTMELTRDMGLGINLGNTFDACGDWIDPSSIDN